MEWLCCITRQTKTSAPNDRVVKADAREELASVALQPASAERDTSTKGEAPWLPLDGCWVKPCSGDVEVMTVNDGVARCNVGWMGSLWRQGAVALLNQEWGYDSHYTLRADGALVVSGDDGNLEDGAVEWVPYEHCSPVAECPGQVRKGGKVASLVQSGCLALVRSSYFEERWEHKQPIQRRQDIPKRYIWDADEAINLWQWHGRLFLTIISYGWLSKEHPDPDCFHLERLAGILRILREYSAKWDLHDLAVVIDFCSLCQKDCEGNRTCEEMTSFREGLAGFPDLYIHLHVTSVKLTQVPDHETRGYDDRGWTLAESICIDSKAGDCNRLSLKFDVGSDRWPKKTGTFDSIMKFSGGPFTFAPLTPEGFKEKLEERRKRTADKGVPLFTNGKADEEVVVRVYQAAFACLQQATYLSFWRSGWSDIQIYDLCKVLRHCQTLNLCLAQQRIGDDGFRVLMEELCAVGVLRCLDIWGNRIGVDGAACLIRLVPRMTPLRAIFIDTNPCCQHAATMADLRNAWFDAGKNGQYLTCRENPWGTG